jgi:hypothetical protein
VIEKRRELAAVGVRSLRDFHFFGSSLAKGGRWGIGSVASRRENDIGSRLHARDRITLALSPMEQHPPPSA